MVVRSLSPIPKILFYLAASAFLIAVNVFLYNSYQTAPLDHHIIESILSFRYQIPHESIFDYRHLIHSWKKPLHYFFAYSISYLLNIDLLKSFISLGLIQVTFFLLATGFVLNRITKNIFHFLLAFAAFLCFFKIFFINIYTLEDNISYYGFVILGIYYFNICYKSSKNILLSGIFLGFATCFYTSQIIHAFAIFPLIPLAFMAKKRHLIKPVLLISGLIITIQQIICKGFLVGRSHFGPLDVFRTIYTFNLDKDAKTTIEVAAFFEIMRAFAKSFTWEESWQDLTPFFYYNFELFLLLALSLFLTKKVYQHWTQISEQTLLCLSLILTSFGYVIIYGPLRISRWDIFELHFLFFICLIIFHPQVKRKLFITLMIGFITFMNFIDFVFRPPKNYVEFSSRCISENYYDYYLKEKRRLKSDQYQLYVFPWSYLSIESYVVTHINSDLENIYFKSPAGDYYQSRVQVFSSISEMWLMEGVAEQFYISPFQQKEIRVNPPDMRSKKVYKSPYLNTGLDECFMNSKRAIPHGKKADKI